MKQKIINQKQDHMYHINFQIQIQNHSKKKELFSLISFYKKTTNTKFCDQSAYTTL